MTTARNRRRPLDVLGRRAVAGSLIGALLTSACAGSVPRLAPPPGFSAVDLKACQALAEKAKSAAWGGSVWESMALGAGAATDWAGNGRPEKNASSASGDALPAVVVLGSMVVFLGAVGSGMEITRGLSAREAAYGDTMDACPRPALLARNLGLQHPEVALSLHALGYRYARQSDFAAAEALYLGALAIQARTLGAEAPE